MEKYLKDSDGEILLDDNGKKILDPAWLATNPSYTPAADESGGGGYVPDAAAQAWHDQQVAGLKAAQSKALATVTKQRTKAETALKEVERLEAENAELRERLGSGEGAIDPKENMELETKVSNLERVRDTLQDDLATTKDELHKYKYEGAIDAAMTGIVKPGYQLAAKATLERLIKENKDGELECFNPDGSQAIHLNSGVPLTVKEFVNDVFAKDFADMCVADTSLPTRPGSKPGGSPKADNPFHKDTLNRTVQSTIIKNNPSQARQLMKAAGYEASKINRMLA